MQSLFFRYLYLMFIGFVLSPRRKKFAFLLKGQIWPSFIRINWFIYTFYLAVLVACDSFTAFDRRRYIVYLSHKSHRICQFIVNVMRYFISSYFKNSPLSSVKITRHISSHSNAKSIDDTTSQTASKLCQTKNVCTYVTVISFNSSTTAMFNVIILNKMCVGISAVIPCNVRKMREKLRFTLVSCVDYFFSPHPRKEADFSKILTKCVCRKRRSKKARYIKRIKQKQANMQHKSCISFPPSAFLLFCIYLFYLFMKIKILMSPRFLFFFLVYVCFCGPQSMHIDFCSFFSLSMWISVCAWWQRDMVSGKSALDLCSRIVNHREWGKTRVWLEVVLPLRAC